MKIVSNFLNTRTNILHTMEREQKSQQRQFFDKATVADYFALIS